VLFRALGGEREVAGEVRERAEQLDLLRLPLGFRRGTGVYV